MVYYVVWNILDLREGEGGAACVCVGGSLWFGAKWKRILVLHSKQRENLTFRVIYMHFELILI